MNEVGRNENEVTSNIPAFLAAHASSERFGPLILDRGSECDRIHSTSAIGLPRRRAETETSYRFFPDTLERQEVPGGSCLLARLGARLAQLGGAFLAANLHGFAADLHFDGRFGVEGIIAGRARLLGHGSFSGSPAYRARSGDHSEASGAVEIFSQMGALPDQVLARNSAGVTP